MKNVKNVVKGFLVLSLLAGAFIASPASADNKIEARNYLNAETSLKADVLPKVESAVGVVLGPNDTLRVMGAKVDSVSGSEIKATTSFGGASLSFTVRADAEIKVNGKALDASFASVIDNLEAGDKISFSGTIVSSSNSSLVVEADHLVSRALYDNDSSKNDDRDDDEDKDERKEEKRAEKREKENNGKSWFGKFRNLFWR
jgi:hypothetical protein